jgi:hypothetical protein
MTILVPAEAGNGPATGPSPVQAVGRGLGAPARAGFRCSDRMNASLRAEGKSHNRARPLIFFQPDQEWDCQFAPMRGSVA